MKFFYKAKDISGNIISNVQESESLKDLVSSLSKQGLFVITVEEVKEELEIETKNKEKILLKRKRIKLKDLADFFKQISTMINAGIPIITALGDISSLITNLNFKEVIEKVSQDIKGGKSFSESLGAHPKIFSNFMVSMVETGEVTGKLGNVLKNVAKYLEEDIKTAGKVKSAITYPVVIVSFLVVVLSVVLFVLVPKFEEIYVSFGAQLPLPTKIVIGISRFGIKFSWVFIGLFIGSIFLFRNFIKKKGVKFWLDKNMFKIPIFGNILLKSLLMRFASTLSLLLKSGVPLVEGLEILGRVLNNLFLQQILHKINVEVTAGSCLSKEMNKYDIFPKMDVRIINIGEETGEIPSLLEYIYNYYKEDVENIITSLTSIIEPILVVAIGVIIGGVIVALYLPIFKLSAAIGGGF